MFNFFKNKKEENQSGGFDFSVPTLKQTIWLMTCRECHRQYFDFQSPSGGYTTNNIVTACPYCGCVGGSVGTISRAVIRTSTAEEQLNAVKKANKLFERKSG